MMTVYSDKDLATIRELLGSIVKNVDLIKKGNTKTINNQDRIDKIRGLACSADKLLKQ